MKMVFYIVVLPAPTNVETETEMVQNSVKQLSEEQDLYAQCPYDDIVEQVVTIFCELCNGVSLDGKQKIKTTSSVLSTAEAISLLTGSMELAGSFGTYFEKTVFARIRKTKQI